MELFDLDQGLKSTASGGHVLSCSEQIGLQAGLQVLKTQEKASSIFFWGKLFGTAKDYYIAFRIKDQPEFDFPDKVFYYAGEDYAFMPLPNITQEMAEKVLSLKLTAPFEGVPTASIGPEEEKLTELHRLIQVVHDVDFDTAAVPKGAHALNENKAIVPNMDFRGLPPADAMTLASYVHFRPPASTEALRAQAKSDTEYFANFLDSLDDDLPKGCWALRQDPTANIVTLRCLSWPGYTAYHMPGTAKFGGLYFGYGQKCRDLPFMM